MKIRCITESKGRGGLFKTPEQVKREMDRREEKSDEETIAQSVNEIIVPKVKKELEEYMNNFEFTDGEDYCSILDPELFGLNHVFFYANANLVRRDWKDNKISKYSVSKINIEGNEIHIEIDVTIADEEYKKNILNSVHRRNPIEFKHGYCRLLDKPFSASSVRRVFAGEIKLAAANYDLVYKNQQRSSIANYIMSKKVVLDKIHIFEGLGGLIFWAWDNSAGEMMEGEWKSKMNNRIAELKQIFVFENMGNITIKNNYNCFLEVRVKRNYEY